MTGAESGATAIEYGLIAGLIALGIVGSLVGTRGSLNSVYGAASSGLGQSTTPDTPGLNFNPANSRTSYWAGKTVKSGPTYSSNANSEFWLTTFTDGSTASIQKYTTAPLIIEQTFEANSLYRIDTAYYNNKIDSVNAVHYDKVGGNTQYVYYSNAFDANNNPTNLKYGVYNGCCATLNNVAMTSAFQTQVANGIADMALWLANTPKP